MPGAQKYPLIVYVHGGPESHHSNNWLSRYSTPGQVMAGKGYLVTLPMELNIWSGKRELMRIAWDLPVVLMGDIPYEDLYVHTGKLLEDQWQLNLERSPIYWAHQSKTATLIYGGAADTRVHPSQSLELYRRMKMNDHPAVRLVQYPGEGHGNRKQTGRIDVLFRQIEWLDWYVRDLKPLDGPMPPLDISDKYGLDWE